MQTKQLSKLTLLCIIFVVFFNMIAWIAITNLIYTAYASDQTHVVIYFNNYNEMLLELILFPLILLCSCIAFTILIKKVLNIQLVERVRYEV